jgi:hypothetical protein
MSNRRFWVVVNKDFPTRITYKHDSFESADKEAKRLARQERGCEFVVMKAQKSYRINDLVETIFVDMLF